MNYEIEYMQKQLSSVWPEWRITGKLGKGTYGSVYEILRDDLGTVYRCALKVLQIEEDESEDAYADPARITAEDRTVSIGYGNGDIDPDSDRSPFRPGLPFAPAGQNVLEDFVRNVSSEIDLMIQLKGFPNIVAIEDYAVLRKRGQRMILIRMELLESLDSRLKRTESLKLKEILRIGTDICTALDACEKRNILHRDIKMSNIYYSDKAGYKLGDFGISRTMDSIHERMSMTSTGTIQYMAPEIYLGKRYDHTVDIYSLGMVLYILMNGGLPPFCGTDSSTAGRGGSPGFPGPAPVSQGGFPGSSGMASLPQGGSPLFPGSASIPQSSAAGSRRPSMAEIHDANMRRLRGEPLPAPAYADPDLASVLSTACAPDPSLRFQSAAAFRNALQAYLNGTGSPFGRGSFYNNGSSSGKGLFYNDDFSSGRDSSDDRDASSGKDSFNGKRSLNGRGSSSVGGSSTGSRRFPLPAVIAAITGILIVFAGLFLFRGNGAPWNTSDTDHPADGAAEGPADTGNGQDTDGETVTYNEQILAEAEALGIDPSQVSTMVSYTVIYRDTNGNSLLDNHTETGVIGESIEVTAPDLEGYTPENDSQTLILSENAQDNIVLFVYKEASPAQEETPGSGSSVVYNTNGSLRVLNKKYTEKNEFDLLAASFRRESGINISVESPKTGKYTKTLNESLTGSSDDPTIFMLSGTRDFEKYGDQCLDLTGCAAAEELISDDYALRGTNGRIYGLACIVESYGLAVNTDLLEQAGYSLQDIRSFRDLKRIAEEITSRKKELGFSAFTSPSIGPAVNGYYRYAEHAPAVPLYYEVRDNSFNSGMELHGYYMDYFEDYIDLCLNNSCVPAKQAASRTLEDAQQEFIRQKAVFHQDGSWAYRTLKDSLNAEMAVIPLYMGIPGEENQGLCSTASYFWCVNKYASDDDIEAALQFLRWMVTSEKSLQIMAGDMDFLLPYRQAYAPDNLFLQTLLEEENEGKTPVIQYYKNGNYEAWINAINNALEAYVNGTGSWDAVTEGFKKLW